MLIKIHGTSGAGKTTAVRALMESAASITSLGSPGRPHAYRLGGLLPEPIYALGSYETACGGMDTVTKVGEQIDLIHRFAALGHVVYEGLLLSTYLGVVARAMEQYGAKHIYAFLDTPIDLCVERVLSRRAEAGNDRPFNPQGTKDKYYVIQRLRGRAEREGYRTATLHYNQPLVPQILELLK